MGRPADGAPCSRIGAVCGYDAEHDGDLVYACEGSGCRFSCVGYVTECDRTGFTHWDTARPPGLCEDAGGARDAAVDGADGGAPACQPCIGQTIGWGPNGGLVAYDERSELAHCNVYRRTRTPAGDPGQKPLACERPVPCMGSGLHGIADVLAALEHADVVAARAKGNVLYGLDARPVDGQVLRIELPGSVIDVGGECGGGGSCVPIPPGVATLAGLLRSIDSEQLAIEPCLSTFE